MVRKGLKKLTNSSKITTFSRIQRSNPLTITQKDRSEVKFNKSSKSNAPVTPFLRADRQGQWDTGEGPDVVGTGRDKLLQLMLKRQVWWS